METDTESIKEFTVASILETEFQKRKIRNPRYSAAAFARDLGFSTTRLTSILKGRFGISCDAAGEIADRLKFKDEQKLFFIDLTMSKHARRQEDRERATIRLKRALNRKKHKELDARGIQILEKWYYPAVLELMVLHNGKISVEHLAMKLNISQAEARAAIDVLIMLGELRTAGSHIKVVDRHTKTDTPIPKKIVRDFHSQVLQLADKALKTQATDKRKNLSTVCSFNSEKLPAAREWLAKMNAEFIQEFCDSADSDSVFAINLNLFQLDCGEKT